MALTRQERTQRIIDKFRGLPGEWDMLKGVLCLDHYGTDQKTRDADRGFLIGWDAAIDGLMIAARMDELNREMIASLSKGAA